jgi:uncharacterized protein (TIGR02118 family)
MMRLTVMYTAPSDAEAFEQHYSEVHAPLVLTVPGLSRFEAARVVGTPDGSPPPFYRVADLYFPDQQGMQSSLGSDEGRRTAQDAAELCQRTGATATMLVSTVE